jgi:hypothetical protein
VALPAGESEGLNLLRALAIGDRIGKGGDVFRSPMKALRMRDLATRKLRPRAMLKSKGYRNHTWRSSRAGLSATDVDGRNPHHDAEQMVQSIFCSLAADGAR